MVTRFRTCSAMMFPALLVCVLAFAGCGTAHLPIFDSGGDSYQGALRIPDIDTSYAIYGKMEVMVEGDPSGAQYFVFEGREGELFRYELNLPSGGSGDHFFPSVFLTGPGLPEPDANISGELERLGLAISEGTGAVGWLGFPNGTVSPEALIHLESEFEPFGQVTFLSIGNGSLSFPETGTYYLVMTGVVLPASSLQDGSYDEYASREWKYLLVTGEKEEFGVVDFIRIPLDWVTIRSFWGYNPVFFMAPTLVVLGLGLALRASEYRVHVDDALRSVDRRVKIAYFVGVSGSLLMIGGGLNQLYFLMVAHFGDYPIMSIALLVIVLQLTAVALGLIGCSRLRGDLKRSGWANTLPTAVLSAVALVVGAGFIAGPVMFGSGSAAVVLIKKNGHRDQ